MVTLNAIIVAAGSGSRAGGKLPKQFQQFDGKPLLLHTVDAFLASSDLEKLVIVLGEGQEDHARVFLPQDNRIVFAAGGATRRQSVRSGLSALADHTAKNTPVLIHDAARPYGLEAEATVGRLLKALQTSSAAVPVLPVADSLVENVDGSLGDAVDRNNFLRVQTPQAFLYDVIADAHRRWDGSKSEPTDDARMVQYFGTAVAQVAGDERLGKITFGEDFERMSVNQAPVGLPKIRIGTGYDVHRLEPGDHIWLCGVRIAHNHKLKGHSDADVGLHALTDAILGAMALGDIGDHFPDTDPQWKGASSDRFLEHAVKLAAQKGFKVANCDVTLICEVPKIKPHREDMRQCIADILAVTLEQVSVKATTTEGLGFTGRREGIAAQAVATLENDGQ